ncbi:MAG: [FeFe] hydrogenase H-cluster maturation GTPase HydF [Clostridia bacterium]|nr:[FeFe] hydrogenase H-cluster maturation GTPase HydF [Clostridia bacterium]
MEKTPLSMRKHIAILGKTNAGKSTLFNLLLGQDAAIVSELPGTTTDPVIKAMELIPYGPVALIDTAGFGDETELGKQRMEKTQKVTSRADLILYLVSAADPVVPELPKDRDRILVFTKCELLNEKELIEIEKRYPNAVFLKNYGKNGLDELKQKMIGILESQGKEEDTLVGDLLPAGSTVVMVVPIDSAAPKGRLILPQVQLLRDCLDHEIKAYVTKETTLVSALENLKRVDLVVTDSQIFSYVDAIVPKEIPLTSFSILLARQKGNFDQYLKGAERIAQLQTGDKILVLEGCTHNSTHEDIGRVKIPKMIEKKTGAKCEYTFVSGYQFPEDLTPYRMALSCGMCMINKQEIASRLSALENVGIPVVNYGVAIAALNGILARAKEVFEN